MLEAVGALVARRARRRDHSRRHPADGAAGAAARRDASSGTAAPAHASPRRIASAAATSASATTTRSRRAVIQRNVFENPGWYTPYTPYQAEIAQGRLESLLNFQTMVSDLTGMEVANASLLDEATAAAEAMALLLRVHKRRGRDDVPGVGPRVSAGARRDRRARDAARHHGARRGSRHAPTFGPDVFGVYVQSPDDHGEVRRPGPRSSSARTPPARCVAVGTDLLALALVTPPGEAGADVVVGSAQRFGVPLGYGGPHAAFFATREEFVRQAPGRHHRRVGRQPRPPRVPHGAADARAAHPPREGDVEHLHGAGAARQHGGVLRRVSRAGRARAASPRACTTRRSRLAAAVGRAGLDADERARTSTRCGSRATPRASRRGARGRGGSRHQLPLSGAGRRSDLARTRRSAKPISPTSSRRSPTRTGASAPRLIPPATRDEPAGRAPPALGVPDASGVQRASLRDGDDAVHPAASSARTSGSTPR